MASALTKSFEHDLTSVKQTLFQGIQDGPGGSGSLPDGIRLPGKQPAQVTSTNMLERLMEGIKRRSQMVGEFPSRAECDGLVGAILIETDEEW